MTDELDRSLRAARALLEVGLSVEEVLGNNAIAPGLADAVRAELERELAIILEPPVVISRNGEPRDWLHKVEDRKSVV